MPVLSVVMPVYNERGTVRAILRKVERAPLPKGVSLEIIIVDDGSSDGTRAVLAKLPARIKVILHAKNRGKGGAVKTGIKAARGDIILIQDADLEYDPRDYAKLVTPIINGSEKVVYGSRRLGQSKWKHSTWGFYAGGVVVTLLTNVLFLSHLTDEPTCYKVFHKSVIKRMRIDNDRFDWEPEVTAKILKQGIHIAERPIRYYPRDIAEGKKIRLHDGLSALWTLVKYRFVG